MILRTEQVDWESLVFDLVLSYHLGLMRQHLTSLGGKRRDELLMVWERDQRHRQGLYTPSSTAASHQVFDFCQGNVTQIVSDLTAHERHSHKLGQKGMEGEASPCSSTQSKMLKK